MLCLQQCIDLCELSPAQVRLLKERATLAEIVAAQAICPKSGDLSRAEATDGAHDIACDLVERVRMAESFDDLRLAALHYHAYSLARAAARG
jgi:hypothetical protein